MGLLLGAVVSGFGTVVWGLVEGQQDRLLQILREREKEKEKEKESGSCVVGRTVSEVCLKGWSRVTAIIEHFPKVDILCFCTGIDTAT